MALMRPGPIGQMSGVLHGMEFSRSGSQSVVKRQKIRQSSTSPARVLAQANQAYALKYWQSLSSEHKMGWNLAAKSRPMPDRFGTPRCLSGLQLFLTIPHDFRYDFVENWLDDPPIAPTPITAWFRPHAYPGYNLLGSPSNYVGNPMLVSAYIARFQPLYSDRGRKVWRKASLYYGEIRDSYAEGLEDSGYSFVLGERIAFIAQAYKIGYWPVWNDYGVITVEAEP